MGDNSNKGRPGSSLNKIDFASTSVDELWELHETVKAVLAKKIAAKLIILRQHLPRLGPEISFGENRSP
jgi:hypothetical protein